jgi:hypothetical protein
VLVTGDSVVVGTSEVAGDSVVVPVVFSEVVVSGAVHAPTTAAKLTPIRPTNKFFETFLPFSINTSKQDDYRFTFVYFT